MINRWRNAADSNDPLKQMWDQCRFKAPRRLTPEQKQCAAEMLERNLPRLPDKQKKMVGRLLRNYYRGLPG